MMPDHELLVTDHDRLKLTAIRNRVDSLLDEAARSDMSLHEALGLLVAREIAQRDEPRITMAGKIAWFLFARDLDGFDGSAPLSIAPRQVRVLATSRWIAHDDTLLLLCPIL